MATHLERHRAEMQRLAYPAVAEFIVRYPQYSISEDQSGSMSVTNYVIFGWRGDERVIFKYFCEDERKEREIYALNHFAESGLVPHLLVDDGKRLIVQSHIAGGGLQEPTASSTVDSQCAGYTLGRAVAKLTDIPLSAQAARAFEDRFYDGLRLEQYLRTILEASWHIHRRVAAYGSTLFAASLESIEALLPYLLAQHRLLYHQDALNMHFVDSTFSGFFDLEMCRVGTEAMQIGSLWTLLASHNNWRAFTQGFAEHSGRELGNDDFYAAQAFAHFLVWRYISRSGRWHGQIDHTAPPTEVEADAASYAEAISLNNKITPGD